MLWVYGGCMLIIWIMSFFLMTFVESPEAHKNDRVKLRKLFSSGEYILFYFMGLIINTCVILFIPGLSPHLATDYHMAENIIPIFYAVTQVTFVFVSLLYTKLGFKKLSFRH
jgi:hypothetical protein